MKIQEIYFVINEYSSFIFEENHVFIEEETPHSNKVVTVEEELEGIDIDGIGNFWDYWKINFWIYLGKCSSMKNVGILKYSLMVENFLYK